MQKNFFSTHQTFLNGLKKSLKFVNFFSPPFHHPAGRSEFEILRCTIYEIRGVHQLREVFLKKMCTLPTPW